MLRKFFSALWLLLVLALLLLLSWLCVAYWRWPLWAIVPVAIVLLFVYWLGSRAFRRWQAWRLARRLAKDQPETQEQINYSLLDQQWKSGLNILRESRLGGRISSLYALPWLLSLQVGEPVTESDYRSLAIRKLLPDGQQDAAALGWYFLKSSVVLSTPALHQSGASAAAKAAWQRLLYHLLRSRRREPLNGLLINIDASWLQNASTHDLLETGKSLRAQHDDITRVFNVRVPVWIVISGASVIAGFDKWAELLNKQLNSQAFGYSSQTTGADSQGSMGFLEQAFAAINQRLAQLRLALGQQTTLDQAAFELPETIAGLQPALSNILVPAFDATPYAATPMLRGLYWCSSKKDADNIVQTYFTQGLYDNIFPKQRDAWQGLSRFGAWGRVLRHVAVGIWGLAAVAVIFGLWVSAKDVSREINAIKDRHLEQLDFEGALEADLQALNIWHDATLRLSRNNQGLASLLPFHYHLNKLEHYYKSSFSTIYQKEIRQDFMDKMVVEDLPNAARNGSDTEIAAWAQYLVRRINMVQARLDKQPLDDLPQPGPGLAYLRDSAHLDTVGLQTGSLIGSLYKDYLLWQSETTTLQGELDGLKASLNQLGLSSRSADWLIAWADLQNNLRPVSLGDFWGVPVPDSAPKIPAGLTSDGALAIQKFAGELIAATDSVTDWQNDYEQISERFQEAGFSAWYRFIAAFDQGKNYLETENNWELVLSSSFTSNDPYWKLLERLNNLFKGLSRNQRPDWLNQAVSLYAVINAADSMGTDKQTVLDKLRSAHALSTVGIRNLGQDTTIPEGVDAVVDGIQAVDEVRAYGENISKVVKQLLQGKGSAVEVASQTWSYGYDPQVEESVLHQANEHLANLHTIYTAGANNEDAIWKIVGGPLAFVLDFTARKTACTLQKEWETTVLGTVQNVRSPVLAYDLLYGERGSVPLFLQDIAASFMDKNALRYTPREVLGQTIPLSGEFFAYASRVQYEQVNSAEQKLQAENTAKQRELRATELKDDKAELEELLQSEAAAPAIITVSNSAPLLNEGATASPQLIRLSQQCAAQLNVLSNYNFPAQSTFQWDPQQCLDTEIYIEFPGFSLQKTYPGKYGFIDFLEDFSSGQKTFTPQDFPAQAMEMNAAGISKLTVRWGIKGADGVLARAQSIRTNEEQLAEIKAELKSIKAAESDNLEHQAQSSIKVTDIVPERIVSTCWQGENIKKPGLKAPAPVPKLATTALTTAINAKDTDASKPANSNTAKTAAKPKPTATKAPSKPIAAGQTSWAIQIGVFANADKVTQQLDAMGIAYKSAQLTNKQGKVLYSISSTDFSDHELALDKANEIAAKLDLKPLLIRKNN